MALGYIAMYAHRTIFIVEHWNSEEARRFIPIWENTHTTLDQFEDRLSAALDTSKTYRCSLWQLPLCVKITVSGWTWGRRMRVVICFSMTGGTGFLHSWEATYQLIKPVWMDESAKLFNIFRGSTHLMRLCNDEHIWISACWGVTKSPISWSKPSPARFRDFKLVQVLFLRSPTKMLSHPPLKAHSNSDSLLAFNTIRWGLILCYPKRLGTFWHNNTLPYKLYKYSFPSLQLLSFEGLQISTNVYIFQTQCTTTPGTKIQ